MNDEDKQAYYTKLCKASEEFEAEHCRFPLKENRMSRLVCKSVCAEETKVRIAEHALGTRILMDQRAFKVAQEFLEHKKAKGNRVERAVYQEMSVNSFIDRLLRKRPLMFIKTEDKTLLRASPSMKPIPMHEQWLRVGSEEEGAPLVLEDYLSYEEMEVSALLLLASPTFFINRGDRENKGKPGADGTFVKEGILIGAVGSRLNIPGLMESKYMLRSTHDDSSSNEKIHNFWLNLYNSENCVERFIQINPEIQLDRDAYAIRLEMILRPIMHHAEAEGRERGSLVLLRLVGFGLGIWAADRNNVEPQAQIYISVVRSLILRYAFIYLDVIELQYILDPSPFPELIPCANGRQLEVRFTRGDVADVLPEGKEEHLLVGTYAWDGNSFPGNEYWGAGRYIGTSGDSAAAACSTISEIQNPYVNRDLLAQDRLCTYPS